ncbi:bacteriophytochrome (light-regulated signal transduction histidine kinase) [Herbaspirillum sp. CF444]|uniref:sensor histidine kinase n=1 Tax=Herbaspirillum sp. CF444 TaxID=1144319 RepID=UPI00027263DF|nr:ATP-binding protein [Herbaspirillum sp. CF444]EJL80706.1 bacteriophytochrome (light-regulated signal transduction histidine kinase) [Herbaspirillum sp. CF444]
MTLQVCAKGIADFRLLFESVPGLFLVLLPDFTITAVSDAYLQATLTRREHIIGRHLFDVFPDNPDDPNADGVANLRRSLDLVLATKMPDAMAMQKYDVPRPDGSGFEERYWSPSNFPVMDEARNILYIMHRVEDITSYVLLKKNRDELGRLHEELQKSIGADELELSESTEDVAAGNQHLHALNRALKLEILARGKLEETNRELTRQLKNNIEKLEASNKELESFSYSVSHDLRAPLRAIDGFARMLEEDIAEQLDEEGRRKLEIIRNNTRNMGRLIDELLEFSRLGRKELNYGHLDMAALAQAAFNDATSAATNTTTLSMDELPVARGDLTLIRQVWFNLLSNACKFSAKREQAHITIKGAVDGGMLTYTVSDNGAGFDMRYYNKLFGVFQRLHRVSEFEGTGVGLAIVHRIVTRHGGRVWAEGAVGEGAAFHFTLPVVLRKDGGEGGNEQL